MLARTCLLALSLCSSLLSPLPAQAAPRYKLSYLPERFTPMISTTPG